MEPAFASKGHHVSVPGDHAYVDYDTFDDDDDDDEGDDIDGYLCISAS